MKSTRGDFLSPRVLFVVYNSGMNTIDYQSILTMEPGKRGGKPCIRGMRITVYDVLSYLASGISREEILIDFPYLTNEDISACLAYAAEREQRQMNVLSVAGCRKDDPGYIERLVEGAAEYRRLLQEQEAKTVNQAG